MDINERGFINTLQSVVGISNKELLNDLNGYQTDIEEAMEFIKQNNYSWGEVRHDILKPFTTKGSYRWYQMYYYPNAKMDIGKLNINYCIKIECFNDCRKKPYKISVYMPGTRCPEKSYNYESEEAVIRSLGRLKLSVEKEYPDYIIKLQNKLDDTKRDIVELSK